MRLRSAPADLEVDEKVPEVEVEIALSEPSDTREIAQAVETASTQRCIEFYLTVYYPSPVLLHNSETRSSLFANQKSKQPIAKSYHHSTPSCLYANESIEYMRVSQETEGGKGWRVLCLSQIIGSSRIPFHTRLKIPPPPRETVGFIVIACTPMRTILMASHNCASTIRKGAHCPTHAP